MQWSNGNVVVSHPREPWGARDLEVMVSCTVDELKGGDGPGSAVYQAAKRAGDMAAAVALIKSCVNERVLDDLASAMLELDAVPRIVYPHPDFDDREVAPPVPGAPPRNVLPAAYAAYLAETLGCVVDDEVIQVARVGRTSLNKWLRFLCQPAFQGLVRANVPYLIVDDVITTGGTFAAIRSYIVRNGAVVPFASTIANKLGAYQELAIAEGTLGVLNYLYGEGLEAYWLGTLGHETKCLTEAEGNYLAKFGHDAEQRGTSRGASLLQCLRNRINEAAATGH